ncbi:MAG: hypothetical protein FJ387_25060 [Verrucomicrobia bacterium]|nr:hypothetical protein [Verrucomicrobiota bacterium]
MKPQRLGLTLATLLAAGMPVALAQVQPELIFGDTFDVSAASDDVNFENAARQSGLVAPLEYTLAGGGLAQVGQPNAANQLRLTSNAYVSPAHNFIEGGQFTIEFDLDPGVNDDPGDGLSGDWAAIVFGASSRHVFVNASDGMGVLFRNNGQIQVFDRGTAVYGGTGDVAIPTDRPFRVRIEVNTADFKGSPATVKMFINDQQARLSNASLDYVKATGFVANYISLDGYGATAGAWNHVIDNFSVAAVPCLRVGPEFVHQPRGQTSAAITVTVPRQLNATQAAQVRVQSLDPRVAEPTGADASGILTLTFAAGGATAQTFTIKAFEPGETTVQVAGPAGTCTLGRVRVIVAAGPGLPEVVFRDTFNASFPTLDINFENDAGRQSGSAGVRDYLENPLTAMDGTSDDYTQINLDLGTGKLYLQPSPVPGVPYVWVAPDYNFLDGGRYTIEFRLDPSYFDVGRTTSDWGAVVFGTTAPGQAVNGSNGMGILFRSNGGLQVFDGAALVHDVAAGTLPAGELDVRIEVDTPNFLGNAPAVVSLFVNGTAFPIGSDGPNYVKATGFRGNYVSLLGYAAANNFWAYLFDDLTISAAACVHATPPRLELGPGEPSVPIEVKVPVAFNQGKSGKVTLRSRNPAVASPAVAVNGALTLDFAAGGPNVQTVQIEAVGKGATFLDLTTDQGVCVGDPVPVSVRTALIANPSFESNYNPTWPHYGSIDAWEGGNGVNDNTGPFHSGGVIPDRSRVAFLQGTSTMSQTLVGLTPGKPYWVQVRYNARACCGGATPDLTVRFEGVDLGTVTGIAPIGGTDPYYARSFNFTPQGETGLLQIATNPTGGAGDSTLTVDAVTVVQRDEGNVVVQNPSFEASGRLPAVGVLAPARLSAWAGEGSYGVDVNGGMFADNGVGPDQDLVAFIQGPGALSQTLVGLLPGQVYAVSFAYNARAGTSPHLRVLAGDLVLLDTAVAPVGGGAAYQAGSGSFTAAASSVVLRFEQTAGGESTVLLDDVKVMGQAVNLPCIEVAPAQLELGIGQQDSTVTVKVPTELVDLGPATVTVTSLDPAVATLEGAVGGVRTLNFTWGGELTQTVTVRGVARGVTALKFANPHGVCLNRDEVGVSVTTTLVRNPSFEANSHPTWPGYGAIVAWSSEGPGNTGINDVTGPFHDNGLIPDRAQVALLQVEKTIRQEIVGLTPGKQYWLQFYYNVRAATPNSMDLSVRFGGIELAYLPTIQAVGAGNPYRFESLPFVPASSSGLLEFSTINVGDATVLLDAVTIVQRDAGNILVRNPSFEASGKVAFPGYIQPQRIAGWTGGGGGRGVNVSGVGPFADNGVNPDQDSVLFLQDAGTFVSQAIGGLTPGQNYTVSFAANARAGNSPRLRVTFGGQTVLEDTIASAGGANPYAVRTGVFTAAAAEGELRFEQTAAGDHTVLIDNVVIVAGGQLPVRLGIRLLATGAVRVSWPASATGYVLQATQALPGGWVNSTAPVIVESGESVVLVQPSERAAFYRLRR